MNYSESQDLTRKNFNYFGNDLLIPAFFSIAAPVATFFVSVSSFSFYAKSIVFLGVMLLYLLFCFTYFSRQNRRIKQEKSSDSEILFNENIEGRLLALEEASRFFGASLKFSDMFRLVSSRINEMIPFAACAIFLSDENKDNLRIAAATGENAGSLINRVIKSETGLAGKTFTSRKAQFDEKLLYDKNVLPAEAQKNLSSALSVPLMSSGEIFGVLIVYGDQNNNFNRDSLELLEAIGERAAPLFTSSRAYEQSVANALTDVLTALPNERAFYLVLENQIAEAQRFPDERSLSILTIDIKNFTELNQKFGHAAGDRVLSFTAGIIKEQLRVMDFLSRSINDEFLAVLPTASENVVLEIIRRIKEAFAVKSFEVSAHEQIQIELNFGAATFNKNGETAQQHLQHANLRRQHAKSEQNSNIAWFVQKSTN